MFLLARQSFFVCSASINGMSHPDVMQATTEEGPVVTSAPTPAAELETSTPNAATAQTSAAVTTTAATAVCTSTASPSLTPAASPTSGSSPAHAPVSSGKRQLKSDDVSCEKKRRTSNDSLDVSIGARV